MLTRMTEADWAVTLEAFRAARSRRGDKGRDDRRFLEALHYFAVHNVTWRALPAEFGNWNSVWKRFWRLSRTGVFEAFFQALAGLSSTAHLVQMLDSTVVRAHVGAHPISTGHPAQCEGLGGSLGVRLCRSRSSASKSSPAASAGDATLPRRRSGWWSRPCRPA
jgi:transposase